MLFSYLYRELRRRSRQAILISVGLAVGIGLVITVSAASSGVKAAQKTVLHSLYGVGTDITVTAKPSAGSFGPARFGGFGGAATAPSAGQQINRTTLRLSPGQGTLQEKSAASISKLAGVAAAGSSLALEETHVSGTVGSGSGSGFGPDALSGLSFSTTSITGVEPSADGLGGLSATEIAKGTYFPSAAAVRDVIVSSTYASQNHVAVGSTLTIDEIGFKVIGIADVPSSSTTSTDLYLTLREAQLLSGMPGKVTTIYVSAASASDVPHVQQAIEKRLPEATVTTAASLANEVTGSLASASSLANTLGTWLSILVLIAAFLVAALLMLAAVSRRVRELGTLKAIGWRTSRVVEQIMGEGITLGIVGGVVGIVLGVLGARLVSLLSPPLTATVGPSFATGGGFPGGGFAGRFPGGGGFAAGGGGFPEGGGFARPAFGAGRARFASHLAHTVTVHLSAPLQGGAVVLAVVLAIAGGLVAGGLGAWRAARLRPAEALRAA